MGLLKALRAPRSLEAQIAGESLFNDGVGVGTFFAVGSLLAARPVAGEQENTSIRSGTCPSSPTIQPRHRSGVDVEWSARRAVGCHDAFVAAVPPA
jgi:hypothetical protein